jgi:hypothetical protein
LPLAGGAIALLFFVEEFAVVLNPADRRHRGGRDFDQIQPALAGDLQGFEGGQDAELLAFFINDADFAGADSLIDSDKLLRGTLIDGCFSLGAGVAARHSVYQCSFRIRCGRRAVEATRIRR